MKPRRILLLNERDPRHPRAGGAEIHLDEIFSRLASRGMQIKQYSTGFPGAKADETLGGIQIERTRPIVRYYASVPIRLRRAAKTREFDLVIDCLNKIPFYAPLFSDIPVLALCHHLFGEVAFRQVSPPVAAAVWLAERGLPFAYRHNRFVAISESTRDDLMDRGIDKARISVSHPGINRPGREPNVMPPRRCRIAYLGRLEAYKRVDVLLRAARELVDDFPDLEILVIGRGGARAELENLARQLEIADRTTFTGFVSDAERDDLLAETRVCAFPSDKEGWGLTVIEANALGTPVVASDAPGLRDSVRDGETGLLAKVGDPLSFAAGIRRLLEDSDFARGVRANCVAWSKRFDWDRSADEMETAIESAILDAAR